jgi:2-keto-3-deoxy-L-rhamnonate aldolase RhmA
MNNADAIASVPGIDVLLIGSNDLYTAMGIPRETRNPKLRVAYEAVAAACRKHDKHLGIGSIRSDPEHVAELIALGARFVIAGSDAQYLLSAGRKRPCSAAKKARACRNKFSVYSFTQSKCVGEPS